MSLVDLLGLDEDTAEWMDLAACNGMGMGEVDYFCNAYESDKVIAASIDEMCITCPVVKSCMMAGQSNNEYGVWGGIYWDGTGKPDEARNAHKTEDVWARLKARLT